MVSIMVSRFSRDFMALKSIKITFFSPFWHIDRSPYLPISSGHLKHNIGNYFQDIFMVFEIFI